MSIADLGSLGEFVGAFAVLATLVYLSVQIRQSNRNAMATARQTVLSNYIDKSFDTSANPTLQAILRNALTSYDQLDAPDKMAYDLWAQFWWGNLYQALLLREDGLLDDVSFGMISNGFVGMVISPGGQEYWREAKKNPSIPDVLVSYVDTCRERPDSLPTSWGDHAHWRS